jgi:hypothetical protein
MSDRERYELLIRRENLLDQSPDPETDGDVERVQ